MLVSKHLTNPICPVERGLGGKKRFFQKYQMFVSKFFLLLVSADELIVCVVPEVERLGMSGGQAFDHRDPTNLDLGGYH